MCGEIASLICHDVAMTENTPKNWRDRWTEKAKPASAPAPAAPPAPPAPPVEVTPEAPRKFESGIFAAKPKDKGDEEDDK